MPSTLDLCEQLYGTRDIYDLLNLEKGANDSQIKKSYHKMSLLVHPDRVAEKDKKLSTEKFKVLSKIYSVLIDKDKRALYNESGAIDDDDEDGKLNSWLDMWRAFFKPITDQDIDNFQKDYIGSEQERTDIKKAYVNGKGCINYMMDMVPFMAVEDEPRIAKIVNEMILSKEVTEFKTFTEEPKSKKNRRHKKYARESELTKIIGEKNASKESLSQQIVRRNENRAGKCETFLDSLMAKYGKEDKSKPYKVPKKKPNNKGVAKTPDSTPRKVSRGRVQKGKK